MTRNSNNKSQQRKNVLIAYKFMPQYRIDFFNRLRTELAKENIDLDVVYGTSVHADRKDEKQLDWGIYRKNRIFRFYKLNLYWQPITDLIRGKDLVIVEQANSLLINYVLLFRRTFFGTKLSFWGHGRNRQGNEKSISNSFKKMLINKCDHWFAYTSSVKAYLLENDYPERKISVVNNSFDTLRLNKQLHSISQEEKETLKKQLNIHPEDDVAIYCGALYREKRLDMLLQIADEIKVRNNNFKLIIIGSGSDMLTVRKYADERSWVHYAGAKFDREKALYFSISQLFLMPGAVGLAVLDSFALETPMILCEIDIHGPEVDYLQDGKNGVFCEDDVLSFAKRSVELFNNESEMKELRQGCMNSMQEITLEKMLSNFVNGIKQCLYEKAN